MGEYGIVLSICIFHSNIAMIKLHKVIFLYFLPVYVLLLAVFFCCVKKAFYFALQTFCIQVYCHLLTGNSNVRIVVLLLMRCLYFF